MFHCAQPGPSVLELSSSELLAWNSALASESETEKAQHMACRRDPASYQPVVLAGEWRLLKFEQLLARWMPSGRHYRLQHESLSDIQQKRGVGPKLLLTAAAV